MQMSASPTLLPEQRYVIGRMLHSGLQGDQSFSVRRTKVDIPQAEQALTWGGVEASVARINLRPAPAREIIQAGKSVMLRACAVGDTSFRNVREPCVWPILHPIDQISFELPQAGIARWAEDHMAGKTLVPEIISGSVVTDAVLAAFAMALVPYLSETLEPAQFFVDCILDGVCAYLLKTFANTKGLARGGLAPWQERRAKEMMDAAVASDLALEDLAASCGLSVAHFSRAFRRSCGTTPYRWLTARRLERAKNLIRTTDLPLALIAVECGFSDQSHLTNACSRHFGVPPGALRRYWHANDLDPAN